jgi:hypothetical protein
VTTLIPAVIFGGKTNRDFVQKYHIAKSNKRHLARFLISAPHYKDFSAAVKSPANIFPKIIFLPVFPVFPLPEGNRHAPQQASIVPNRKHFPRRKNGNTAAAERHAR